MCSTRRFSPDFAGSRPNCTEKAHARMTRTSPRSRFAYSGFLVSAGGLSAALSIHDLTSGDVIGSISSQARHLQTPDCFPPGWSTGTIGFPHFGQGLRNASAKIVLPPRERRIVRCDLSISIAPIIWVTVRLKRRRVFSIPDHRIRRGFCRSPMEIVAAFKLLINPRRRIAASVVPCRFAHGQLPTQARTVSLRII